MMIELEYNPFERLAMKEAKSGKWWVYLLGGTALLLLGFFIRKWLFPPQTSVDEKPKLEPKVEKSPRQTHVDEGANFLPSTGPQS